MGRTSFREFSAVRKEMMGSMIVSCNAEGRPPA